VNRLEVKHFVSTIPRHEAFSGKVRYRDELFEYRIELARAHRRYTSRYARELSEINLLIDALAPAGLIPEDILPLAHRKFPTPDFKLKFSDQTVYCECTSAGDSASMLWSLSVADLQIAANDMLHKDLSLAAKLGSRYLAFIPGTPIRPDDILATVDEIGTFIASENLDYYGSRYGLRVPSSFALLSKARAVAYTSRAETPLVLIQQPASAFGGAPEGLAELLRALYQKQNKRYDNFQPIWLVIGAADVLAPLDQVIGQFAAHDISLDPFERVFIATSRESFMISTNDLTGP
jgi:hypothetical protein